MILMNDFKSEPLELRQAMLNAASRVFESGWFILGNELSSFEKEWADTCGVAHGIGVGNGMDAIEIALRASGLGPGDEVITTPMTAFATVLAIIRAGATPVLADIESTTALMSIESAKRCVTSATRAVVLVHLYGQVRMMNHWIDFCEEHELMLIEDCAQCHQASWNGGVAGSFGAFGAYSFYPTKNLGALGDAGMLITGDGVLAQRAGVLRNYGQSVRYCHPVLGLNSRLDELQAAILAERLKWLPKFTERRRQVADAYRAGIENPGIVCLAEPEDPLAHVYHLFVVTCDRRDALQSHLMAEQVHSLIHYPIPIHEQEPCRQLARDPEGLLNSERHASTCLSVPCHPQMSDTDIAVVIRAINAFQGT
jgi:dTDP-4-amino-4,6-dideoxygalactose transaminase